MFKLDKFFSKGLKDSVLLTGSMSHNGPWKQAYADTLIDRFHVSDFQVQNILYQLIMTKITKK